MKTLEETYVEILKKEREEELFVLLQQLDAKQKKELLVLLEELGKEYLDYKPHLTGYKQKATPAQADIRGITAFVCSSRAAFEKNHRSAQIINKKALDKVLGWYCPSWFNDYINSFAGHAWIRPSIHYAWVMELSERGLLNPLPELLAKLLPQLLYEARENNQWVYAPHRLLERSITLEEHLWYVFAFETDIHLSERYLDFAKEDGQQDHGWSNALNTYCRQGKIDRVRLLKESLQATSRGFNKNLSGWFAELFIQLQPSKEELLALQHELFLSFNAPHSKVVNTALKCIKGLATEKGFDAQSFLDQAVLLLSSETKAVVASTLMVLDSLAKKHPQKRANICQTACGAFIHADDKVQIRAAKLILKWGDPADEGLQANLGQYYESLFSEPKGLLQAYAGEQASPVAMDQLLTETPEEVPLQEEAAQIPPVESFDELLYLASQAFDNNEPYHLDLLMASLLNLQEQLRGENIAKLEPAFQRAYKLVMGDWPSGMGFLDHLLATFFIDWGRLLCRKYPEEARPISRIHQEQLALEKKKAAQWKWYKTRLGSLQNWSSQSGCSSYKPYKQLLQATLQKLEKEDKLPLLSTPTHTLGWLSASTLAERLQAYQLAGVKPHDMDLQLALSRCILQKPEAALEAVECRLSGEYRALMRFLLLGEQRPQPPFGMPSAWMMAAIRKDPHRVYPEFNSFSYARFPRQLFTGDYRAVAQEEKYTTTTYNSQQRKYVEVEARRKTIRLQMEAWKKRKAGLLAALSRLIPFQRQEAAPLLYEFLSFKVNYLVSEHNDARRLLMLTPHNPEPLLAQVMHKSLVYASFSEEGDRKLVTATIEALYDLWTGFGRMAHLFVASCLLCSDKTIRTFAAEIWIRGVSSSSIDAVLLGEQLGLQEQIEFAPLKRFTDLVISHMFQLSPLHNAELEKVLLALLLQLPPDPIKNLKKLLEIYLEVLVLNGGTASASLLSSKQLASWKNTASLGKVIKAIEERASMQKV